MTKPVIHIIHSQQTSDGAGVQMKRLIGTHQLSDLDPFLLLDEFGSEEASDYIGGFPDHPHRGFQTVTYMLAGKMRHHDNKGNAGVIGPGDVQWMNAGSGLIHSEMPEQTEGRMRGFQLWINLPAAEKMSRPGYQELASDAFPVITRDGATVKVIAGDALGATGPIKASGNPLYLDVGLDLNAAFTQALNPDHTSFLYVYDGRARVEGRNGPVTLDAGTMGILEDGDIFQVAGETADARFILLSAAPLGEPVARHGPFVMNTQGEIRQAIRDFADGRF